MVFITRPKYPADARTQMQPGLGFWNSLKMATAVTALKPASIAITKKKLKSKEKREEDINTHTEIKIEILRLCIELNSTLLVRSEKEQSNYTHTHTQRAHTLLQGKHLLKLFCEACALW